ncbi:MAG: exonuclease SbcCD subunit D [Schaedlerella sp.]
MKFIHLSDLHLGKRVNGYSMLEDQEYILNEIKAVITAEAPDAVLIAGDVYDKPVPPAEAVRLFDDFLVQLSRWGLKVFVISGNHDSPERIAFGSRLMDASGIYLSPVYDGTVTPVSLHDTYGVVDIYMLPFLKPAHVRRFYETETEQIQSYTDAMQTAISHLPLDHTRRNVLITHQFVTGSVRAESEEISVGGSDNIDASVFAPFDYVALGHLHTPQNCGQTAPTGAAESSADEQVGAPHDTESSANEQTGATRDTALSAVEQIGATRIRYCGTPLKYSFSEAKDRKSVTVIELYEKGNLHIHTVPLKPLHDLVELKGTYDTVTARSFYEGTSWQEDYPHITLTDEEDIPDAIGKLRAIYHHLMKLDYDNKRTRSSSEITADLAMEEKTPIQLFSDFYELQNNQPLNEEQATFLNGLIETIWEEDV